MAKASPTSLAFVLRPLAGSLAGSSKCALQSLLPMEKTFTLLHTVATAGVFSAVSFWYGFMFGRESARKELGDLIDGLRRDGDGGGGGGADSTSRA